MYSYIKNNLIARAAVCTMLTIMLMAGISCKKALDQSSTQVSPENLQWTSINDSRSALMGVYGLFRSALANNYAQWVYGDLRFGDFSSYNRPDLDAAIRNQLNASFPMIKDLTDWRRFYAVINSAAVFIEHAPAVVKADPKYSQTNLVLDIAQVRALRALAYFYLVRIWGDVPLVTYAYDNGTFPAIGRTSATTVLDYAQRELQAAAIDLPYYYGVSPQTYYGFNQSNWTGVLLNKVSAYAILAHMAAWQGNYVNTDVYAGLVMDNAAKAGITASSIGYLTAANGIFQGRQPAQLVAFGAIDFNGESSGAGHLEDLTLAQPFVARVKPQIFVSRDTLSSMFTDAYDFRFGTDTLAKTFWTNYITGYNSSTPVFSKIKVIRDGVSDGSYPVFGSAMLISRLEDIQLLRAEAMAALNRREEAIRYLNLIRQNRGVPLFLQTSSANIVDAIFAERRRELMGEGWRWYDLIRYHKIRQKDTAFSRLIQTGGIYWPVSTSVLSANSLIQQNPYWK